MSESDTSTIYSEDYNGHRDIDWAVHVTRNPWGWSEDDQRTARLMVVDAYELMVRLTAGAVVEPAHVGTRLMVGDKLASTLDIALTVDEMQEIRMSFGGLVGIQKSTMDAVVKKASKAIAGLEEHVLQWKINSRDIIMKHIEKERRRCVKIVEEGCGDMLIAEGLIEDIMSEECVPVTSPTWSA